MVTSDDNVSGVLSCYDGGHDLPLMLALVVYYFRPYFTYWITFVQVVVFIVSVSVYGIAPIGVNKRVESRDVLVTKLYPKTIGFEEPENFWIGPRQVCTGVIEWLV